MTSITDVASMDSFSLTFVGAEAAKGAVIYANDENTVAVNVSVNLYDNNGDSLLLSPGDLLNNLALYSAIGGDDTALDFEYHTDKLHLHYSEWPGDYLGPVQYMNAEVNDTSAKSIPNGTGNNNYTFYIYAKPGVAKSSTVYARLNNLNTEVAEFKKGYVDTYHSEFQIMGISKVTIQCLDEINFSNQTYWKVDEDKDVKWMWPVDTIISGECLEGEEWRPDTGIRTNYKKFHLICQPPYYSDFKIFKRDVEGTTIGSNGQGGSFFTNSVSADFYFDCDDLAKDSNKAAYTWWVEPGLEGRYSTLFKYVGYNDLYMYYYYFSEDSGKKMHLRVPARQDHTSIDTAPVLDNGITLYLWAINPNSGQGDHSYQDGWSDVRHDSAVTIYDKYGNSGKVNITFPEDSRSFCVNFG